MCLVSQSALWNSRGTTGSTPWQPTLVVSACLCCSCSKYNSLTSPSTKSCLFKNSICCWTDSLFESLKRERKYYFFGVVGTVELVQPCHSHYFEVSLLPFEKLGSGAVLCGTLCYWLSLTPTGGLRSCCSSRPVWSIQRHTHTKLVSLESYLQKIWDNQKVSSHTLDTLQIPLSPVRCWSWAASCFHDGQHSGVSRFPFDLEDTTAHPPPASQPISAHLAEAPCQPLFHLAWGEEPSLFIPPSTNLCHPLLFFPRMVYILPSCSEATYLHLQFLALVVVLFPFVLQLTDLAMELGHHTVMLLLKRATSGLFFLQAKL